MSPSCRLLALLPTLLFSTTTSFCVLPSTTASATTTTQLLDQSTDTTADTTVIDNNDTCQAPPVTMQFRSVRKILPRTSPHWVGDGFRVYPVFANSAFTEELSPLLMFDYAEPKKFPAKVGPPLGVGQHPHRGFETVTVAFQGEVEHADSTGKKDVIGSGDVQWMTAGRGIIHQEYHSPKFTKEGGVFEMCQLWVNLPKKYKMTKPGYQAILKQDIPVVPLPLAGGDDNDNNTPTTDEQAPLGHVRIIAGEFGGTSGAAKTFSPVQMWDVNLPQKGSEVDLPFPANHNCMVFVRRGRVQVLSGQNDENDNNNKLKESDLGPQDVALMHMDGSNVLRLRVQEKDTSVMILGGEPLNEPIAAQGPFVMNTYDEIRKAISDYRLGKFGR